MKVGTLHRVGVDAGCIWIGDPCYVMGADSSHGVKEWGDFCRRLNHSLPVCEPLGEGIGLCIDSGYGDGLYDVEVEYNGEGKPARVVITFIEPKGDNA